MKKLALATVIAAIVALPGTASWAHGNGSHTRNPNAATPAIPGKGSGTPTTPAVPGNPTAQLNVQTNRPALPPPTTPPPTTTP